MDSLHAARVAIGIVLAFIGAVALVSPATGSTSELRRIALSGMFVMLVGLFLVLHR